VQRGRKRYVGRFRLGLTSNTDDIEGEVCAAGDCSAVTESQLVELLPRFVGTIQQVPPQFSAVHVAGQRAYAKARRGETMDLAARPVEVHSIQLTNFQLPDFELDIVCGSGTYIRSIGRDIGRLLGCGVVMTGLRRLEVGPFQIGASVQFDSLSPETLPRVLLPPQAAVTDLPQRRVDGNECLLVRQGRSLPLGTAGDLERAAEAALVDDRDTLVGIAEVDPAAARLLPRIVFPAADT
jgi:tRNA pseudouridine55 synthase